MVDHVTHMATPSTGRTVAQPVVATLPGALVRTLVSRTKDYLAREVGIEATDTRLLDDKPDHLTLKHSTAVIRVGGEFSALIAFSFPATLIDVVYRRLTADIDVPESAEALYRQDALAEMANIIIGTCTSEFSISGGRISMSAPVVLEGSRKIPRENNAVFGRVSLDTRHGSFDINLVGPIDLFDGYLNYLQ